MASLTTAMKAPFPIMFAAGIEIDFNGAEANALAPIDAPAKERPVNSCSVLN